MARGGKGGHTPHRPAPKSRLQLAGLVRRHVKGFPETPTMGGAAPTGRATGAGKPTRKSIGPTSEVSGSKAVEENRRLIKTENKLFNRLVKGAPTGRVHLEGPAKLTKTRRKLIQKRIERIERRFDEIDSTAKERSLRGGPDIIPSLRRKGK